MAHLQQNVVDFLQTKEILVSTNTTFLQRIEFNPPCSIKPIKYIQNCSIDAYSYCSSNGYLSNAKIGRYCSFAVNVHIGFKPHNSSSTFNSPLFADSQDFAFAHIQPEAMHLSQSTEATHPDLVEIGNDVWIGNKVKIASGVKIGTGAVIGASAVITKDVPPYAIVVGFDRHVKNRFSDEVISDLLESQWWQYDIPEMSHLGVEFPFTEPQRLHQFLKDLDPSLLRTIPERWMVINAS